MDVLKFAFTDLFVVRPGVMLPAESHKILNNILALAPPVYMMHIDGQRSAPFAGNKILFAVIEVTVIYSNVRFHNNNGLRVSPSLHLLSQWFRT